MFKPTHAETLHLRAFLRIARAGHPSAATRALQRRTTATAAPVKPYLRIARGRLA